MPWMFSIKQRLNIFNKYTLFYFYKYLPENIVLLELFTFSYNISFLTAIRKEISMNYHDTVNHLWKINSVSIFL